MLASLRALSLLQRHLKFKVFWSWLVPALLWTRTDYILGPELFRYFRVPCFWHTRWNLNHLAAVICPEESIRFRFLLFLQAIQWWVCIVTRVQSNCILWPPLCAATMHYSTLENRKHSPDSSFIILCQIFFGLWPCAGLWFSGRWAMFQVMINWISFVKHQLLSKAFGILGA